MLLAQNKKQTREYTHRGMRYMKLFIKIRVWATNGPCVIYTPGLVGMIFGFTCRYKISIFRYRIGDGQKKVNLNPITNSFPSTGTPTDANTSHVKRTLVKTTLQNKCST